MAEMNREFFVVQMARLSLIFRGSFDGAEGQARLDEYYEALGRCRPEDLEEAASNMIQVYNKDWFPIPADIREFVKQAAVRRRDRETAIKQGMLPPPGENHKVRRIDDLPGPKKI